MYYQEDMMIDVDVGGIKGIPEELENIRNQLSVQIEVVQQAIFEECIFNLSENFEYRLKKEKLKLEEINYKLFILFYNLERIAGIYERTEKYVEEVAENGRTSAVKAEVKKLDISEYISILHSIGV